jgi:hypothetical protein
LKPAGHSDYYNNTNSFLNCILSRRIGIPLTLTLFFIAICTRLGIQGVYPVGMPGHFICCYKRQKEGDGPFIDDSQPSAMPGVVPAELGDVLFFIDVFKKASILSYADCEAFLNRNFSYLGNFNFSYLAITPAADILHRTLNNVLREDSQGTHVGPHGEDITIALDFLGQEDLRIANTSLWNERPRWSTSYLYISLQIQALSASVARAGASATITDDARGLQREVVALMRFVYMRLQIAKKCEDATTSHAFKRIFMATMLHDVRSDLKTIADHLPMGHLRAQMCARFDLYRFNLFIFYFYSIIFAF